MEESPETCRHEAWVYRNDDELAEAAGFVTEGLEQREPVIISAPHRVAEPLRRALGTASAGVIFDKREAPDGSAPRLSGTHALLSRFLDSTPRRVRLLTSVLDASMRADLWDPLRWEPFVFYEAGAESLLTSFQVSMRCLYHRDALTRWVEADVYRVHPRIATTGSSGRAAPTPTPGSCTATELLLPTHSKPSHPTLPCPG